MKINGYNKFLKPRLVIGLPGYHLPGLKGPWYGMKNGEESSASMKSWELFEKGKKLFDEGQYAEAFKYLRILSDDYPNHLYFVALAIISKYRAETGRTKLFWLSKRRVVNKDQETVRDLEKIFFVIEYIRKNGAGYTEKDKTKVRNLCCGAESYRIFDGFADARKDAILPWEEKKSLPPLPPPSSPPSSPTLSPPPSPVEKVEEKKPEDEHTESYSFDNKGLIILRQVVGLKIYIWQNQIDIMLEEGIFREKESREILDAIWFYRNILFPQFENRGLKIPDMLYEQFKKIESQIKNFGKAEDAVRNGEIPYQSHYIRLKSFERREIIKYFISLLLRLNKWKREIDDMKGEKLYEHDRRWCERILSEIAYIKQTFKRMRANNIKLGILGKGYENLVDTFAEEIKGLII